MRARCAGLHHPRMLDLDFPELGVVRLARPCSQKWSQMKGTGRVRLCAACDRDVYNFAEISSEEARQLLRANAEGGRICARLYKRFDGTVMTADCPKGFWRGWQLAGALLPYSGGLWVAFVVLFALAVGVFALFGDNLRRLNAMSGECHFESHR